MEKYDCEISHKPLSVCLDNTKVTLLAQMVKNPPAMWETWSVPGLGRSPGGGHGNPLQYSCLENPHGQRSLVGQSPQGRKELDSTEQLSGHYKGCLEELTWRHSALNADKRKGSTHTGKFYRIQPIASSLFYSIQPLHSWLISLYRSFTCKSFPVQLLLNIPLCLKSCFLSAFPIRHSS